MGICGVIEHDDLNLNYCQETFNLIFFLIIYHEMENRAYEIKVPS